MRELPDAYIAKVWWGIPSGRLSKIERIPFEEYPQIQQRIDNGENFSLVSPVDNTTITSNLKKVWMDEKKLYVKTRNSEYFTYI